MCILGAPPTNSRICWFSVSVVFLLFVFTMTWIHPKCTQQIIADREKAPVILLMGFQNIHSKWCRIWWLMLVGQFMSLWNKKLKFLEFLKIQHFWSLNSFHSNMLNWCLWDVDLHRRLGRLTTKCGRQPQVELSFLWWKIYMELYHDIFWVGYIYCRCPPEN